MDDEEITGIVCTKQRIITVGWSKKVAIYKDSRSDEVRITWLSGGIQFNLNNIGYMRMLLLRSERALSQRG